jgi:hypothetical protein
MRYLQLSLSAAHRLRDLAQFVSQLLARVTETSQLLVDLQQRGLCRLDLLLRVLQRRLLLFDRERDADARCGVLLRRHRRRQLLVVLLHLLRVLLLLLYDGAAHLADADELRLQAGGLLTLRSEVDEVVEV